MNKAVSVFLAVVSIATGFFATALPARADAAYIVGLDSALSALERAQHQIVISAYTISPLQRALIGDLEAAAARGVKVDVVLTGEGERYALDQNREVGAALRQAHVRVDILQRPIHLKGLVIDSGAFVALDDENWSRASTIVVLPSAQALPVERAMIGDPHDAPPLTFVKSSSLRFEAALIRQAHSSIVVETESFGADNPVSDEIVAKSSHGISVTLIVASKEYGEEPIERNYLALLSSRDHVKVLLQQGTGKGALIDGHLAWIGSANASPGEDNQLDWGFASADAGFVSAVARSLNQ